MDYDRIKPSGKGETTKLQESGENICTASQVPAPSSGRREKKYRKRKRKSLKESFESFISRKGRRSSDSSDYYSTDDSSSDYESDFSFEEGEKRPKKGGTCCKLVSVLFGTIVLLMLVAACVNFSDEIKETFNPALLAVASFGKCDNHTHKPEVVTMPSNNSMSVTGVSSTGKLDTNQTNASATNTTLGVSSGDDGKNSSDVPLNEGHQTSAPATNSNTTLAQNTIAATTTITATTTTTTAINAIANDATAAATTATPGTTTTATATSDTDE